MWVIKHVLSIPAHCGCASTPSKYSSTFSSLKMFTFTRLTKLCLYLSLSRYSHWIHQLYTKQYTRFIHRIASDCNQQRSKTQNTQNIEQITATLDHALKIPLGFLHNFKWSNMQIVDVCTRDLRSAHTAHRLCARILCMCVLLMQIFAVDSHVNQTERRKKMNNKKTQNKFVLGDAMELRRREGKTTQHNTHREQNNQWIAPD